jgi:hypothetical protein
MFDQLEEWNAELLSQIIDTYTLQELKDSLNDSIERDSYYNEVVIQNEINRRKREKLNNLYE